MDSLFAGGVFITGTDTGIGKTWTSVALMEYFKQRGLLVAGMKPVASGCEETDSGLVNDDALLLRANGSGKAPYTDINPYAFAPPIAPHIAASRAGVEIDPGRIYKCYKKLADTHDVVVVEGVGGWRVPVTRTCSTADLVRGLQLPVVLVVGLRLGCINHALLTHESIRNDGIALAGWVANRMDPGYGEEEETLALFAEKFCSPPLGVLPYLQACDPSILAAGLKIPA